MASHPLETSWLRLERAETHLNEIEREITAFFQANPHEMVVHEHLNEAGETWRVVKMRKIAKLPRILPAAVSDAAANIRAPLDYAVARVCEIAPRPDVDCDRLLFPIGNSLKAFQDELKRRKIATFSPDLAALISEAKPYAGGNDLLYALHHLGRKERHVDLAAIGLLQGRYSGRISVGPGGIAYFVLPDVGWHALDEEISIASFNVPEFEVNLQVPLNISIRKPEVFQDQPVGDALRQAAGAVKDLLLRIEKRFF